MRPNLTAVLTWCILLLLIVVALRGLRAPDPVPATAPPEEFSAGRAMMYDQVVARTPHPIGSPANDAVRQYLMDQLTDLGLKPAVFSSVGISNGDGVSAAFVQDIVARLPGTSSSKAIMLMAHYDSVYRTPGAGDDGAAVAAILETVRALRAGSPLKNDIIVLFTDGEEPGLMGAEAFHASHPWAKDAGFILNLEGRGNHGASLLFETSAGNQRLLAETAVGAAHPIGSSLFYALYKLLPNDTDFTVFQESKIPGLNVAFAAGLEAYHSRLDTPANMSAATLQHHGSYALSLTRHFGQMDLTELAAGHGDAVFFDWYGDRLVTYPESWVIPGQILATILVIAVLVMALKAVVVRARKLFLAFLLWIVFLALVALLPVGVTFALNRLMGSSLIASDSTSNNFLLAGMVLLSTALAGYLLVLFRKRISISELSLAALLLLCGVSWAVTLILPAGSYFLFWPQLLLALGWLLALFGKRINLTRQFVASLPSTIAAVLLFAPLLYLAYVLLTLEPPLAAAAGLLVALLFMAATPVMSAALPDGNAWKGPVAGLLLASLVCLGTGMMQAHPSPEHPRHDTIAYSLDPDNHTAMWLSYDRSLDAFTSQYFPKPAPERRPLPNVTGGTQSPVFAARAPVVELPAPVVEVKSDEKNGDVHKLHLVLRSPRGAGVVYARFPDAIKTTAVTVAGRIVPLSKPMKAMSFDFSGFGHNDIELYLTVESSAPLSLWVVDESAGLPPSSYPGRSDNFLAWYGSDVTLVTKKITL